MFVWVINTPLVLLNETHFLLISILFYWYQFKHLFFETNLRQAGSEVNSNKIILQLIRYEAIIIFHNWHTHSFKLCFAGLVIFLFYLFTANLLLLLLLTPSFAKCFILDIWQGSECTSKAIFKKYITQEGGREFTKKVT